MAYDTGSTIRVAVAITNSTLAAREPDSLLVRVNRPDGSLGIYNYNTSPDSQVIRTGVGLFYIDVELSTVGSYDVQWQCKDTIGRISTLNTALDAV